MCTNLYSHIWLYFYKNTLDISPYWVYNLITRSDKETSLNQTKGVDSVSKQRKPKKRQKKSGNQDKAIQKIILITAVLDLIGKIIDFIDHHIK